MRNRRMWHAGAAQAVHEAKFLALIIVGVLLFSLVVMEPAERFYDRYIRARPFVSAELQLVPGKDRPTILYASQAERPVEAYWSAWVQSDGKRLCGGYGKSGYGPPVQPLRAWAWGTWLGRDCYVPDAPFRVCVRYVSLTGTGVRDVSGPFCSAEFDPKG